VKKFIRKNQPLPKLMKNEGMPPLPDVPHINPSQMPKGLEAGVAWLCDQFAKQQVGIPLTCLLYTSPSPRDRTRSRMPSSA